VTDPLATSKVALMIQGTDGADAIWVRPSGTSTTTYLVTMGSVTQTVTGITGRVVVFGFAGNDSINLASARIATRVDAGDGNDIVQGGTAADIIFGGNGADLLIGGLGADTISGDAGNDILVDGTVALTQAGDTLMRVLTTWSSVAVPTTTIYNNITARLRMKADTAARDTLKGLAGSDWFWSAVSQNTGVLADILDAPVEKRRTV
jgi:Ca2+-binding RTX toxin-like protein